MFPEFFVHKAKEVLSFLHIMKGKATGDDKTRMKGVDEALNAMDEERQIYLKEKKEADRKVDSDIPIRNKNGRDEPSRDVSAI